MSAVFKLASNRDQKPLANERPCPRCGGDITEALGAVNSSLDWFRCVLCRHIWTSRPLRNDSAD